MPTLSDLWRVRGAIPVPLESDDFGLMGRVADIVEQSGLGILEESESAVHIYENWLPLKRGRISPIVSIEHGQVRREGIRGRRILSYDFPALNPLIHALLANALLTSGLYFLLGDLPWPSGIKPYLALLFPTMAFVGIFAMLRLSAARDARDFLHRAL